MNLISRFFSGGSPEQSMPKKSINNWLLNTDRGKQAFDTVDHDILFEKSYCCYGLQDKELSLFQCYLSDRLQCCGLCEW